MGQRASCFGRGVLHRPGLLYGPWGLVHDPEELLYQPEIRSYRPKCFMHKPSYIICQPVPPYMSQMASSVGQGASCVGRRPSHIRKKVYCVVSGPPVSTRAPSLSVRGALHRPGASFVGQAGPYVLTEILLYHSKGLLYRPEGLLCRPKANIGKMPPK